MDNPAAMTYGPLTREEQGQLEIYKLLRELECGTEEQQSRASAVLTMLLTTAKLI